MRMIWFLINTYPSFAADSQINLRQFIKLLQTQYAAVKFFIAADTCKIIKSFLCNADDMVFNKHLSFFRRRFSD